MTPTAFPAPTRRRRAALVALLALVLGLLAIPAALAQDEAPAAAPTILLVDAGDDPGLIVRTESEPSQVSVAVDGVEVDSGAPRSLGSTDITTQTAIIIDNGAESEATLSAFLGAAADYLALAPSTENVAIWTTGGSARLRVGMNNEHARTAGIVTNVVTAAGSNHLWDTIRDAAMEIDDPVAGATNLIVLSGAQDTESQATSVEARGAVLSSGASAFVVAEIDADNPDLASLTRLAAATPGGAYAESSDVSAIEGYGTSVSQVVDSTWYVDFDIPADSTANQVSLVVDGVTVNASYVPGSVASGAALEPFEDSGGGGISFLQGDNGRTIGLVLGALAAGLAAWAVVMLLQKDTSGLSSVLQPYSDQSQLPDDLDTSSEHGKSAIAKSLLFKRAVEITEDFAERRGVLSRSEAMLERADMPLRAGEALTAYAGIVLVAIVVGFLLTGELLGAAILGLAAVLVPPAFVNFKAARRRKTFMHQLPDTLQLLASTLKAGYSFMQGIEAVSQEIDDPMGEELRRIVTEAQLGRPVEDAMDASAERMGSADFAWAVMAVKIQREVGGNLSELLMTVAETMTARERLRRDIAALTAEGRISAIVLGALPLLLGLAMWAINPEYINTLFEETVGQVLLGASVLGALIGFVWMKKIIDIDV